MFCSFVTFLLLICCKRAVSHQDLQCLNKSHEGFSALFRAFVYTCIFQDMYKYISHFFVQNFFNVIFVQMIVFWKEALYPVRMLLNLLIGGNILTFQNVLCKQLQFLLQSCRKNRKSHNLDQTDVLLLNMMILCMRMIYAQRILLCSDVVS